jgi:hypothetical protein
VGLPLHSVALLGGVCLVHGEYLPGTAMALVHGVRDRRERSAGILDLAPAGTYSMRVPMATPIPFPGALARALPEEKIAVNSSTEVICVRGVPRGPWQPPQRGGWRDEDSSSLGSNTALGTDGPISGSSLAAEHCELTLFAGGEYPVFETHANPFCGCGQPILIHRRQGGTK